MDEKEDVEKHISAKKEKLKEVSDQYDKLRTLLSQKGYSRTRRQNTSTTLSTITDSQSSVRYRRRQETKDVLEYIHGGKGAIFGAWDFATANASKDTMDTLLAKYKRGKYLESVLSKAMKDSSESEGALTQAIALKYHNFLSRRKFNMLCKTQPSLFDTDREVWVPSNMKCLGIDVQLRRSISNHNVEKFVKQLDIGSVSQIPNVSGVTRTITGLVFMIIELHLRLPYLCRQLVWFNGNNHFIFQFSDDGAHW